MILEYEHKQGDNVYYDEVEADTFVEAGEIAKAKYLGDEFISLRFLREE